MSTLSLDPLAEAVHARIEQLRREGDASRLARSTGSRRAPSWPAGIVAALRDSVAAGFSRPARATTNSANVACCT